MNETTMTPHIPGVNGRRKAQAPEFFFLNGATTTRPDDAYGCVKSTILVLLVTMAISPTAASKFYKKKYSAYVCKMRIKKKKFSLTRREIYRYNNTK